MCMARKAFGGCPPVTAFFIPAFTYRSNLGLRRLPG